jgi:hypothetical protein
MDDRQWVRVVAGSEYGCRVCWYEIIEGVLVLRDEGDHDNLAGNSAACNLEGMTLDQARQKAAALNSEGSGHSYDGCHACTWFIRVWGPQEWQGWHELPDWLTYDEPGDVAVIAAAIRTIITSDDGVSGYKPRIIVDYGQPDE